MLKYDVAVVGAGLGGLTVAALCAKRNRKTIVLEPGETISESLRHIRRDDFSFSASPSLSLGFERGGILHDIYSELGITHSESVLSPCFQVVLPDHRINVYDEAEKTVEELGREFSPEVGAIKKLYQDIRKVSTQISKSRFYAYRARHRKAGGFIRSYQLSHELTQFFNVQSLFFFQRPVYDISLSSLARLLDTAPLYLHGGVEKLAQQLLDVILRNGGEIRYSEPWPALSTPGGRTARLETGRGQVEAEFILFNTQQRARRTHLLLAVRDDVIPVGMAQELICLSEYARLEENFFSLSVNARDDESFAPSGKRSLTATFTNPEQGPADALEFFGRIETIIPFLKSHMVFSQEYRPEPRIYPFPSDVAFKPVVFADDAFPMVSRTSYKNAYVLYDDRGTPAQAVYAARRLAEQLP